MRDRQIETRGKNAQGLQYRGPIRILAPWEREQHADRAEPAPPRRIDFARAVDRPGAGGSSGGDQAWELPPDDAAAEPSGGEDGG